MDDTTTMVGEILDACLRNEKPSRDALTLLDRRKDMSSHLIAVVHELHHFADDEDIRSTDPTYADYWRERLTQLRAGLKSDP